MHSPEPIVPERTGTLGRAFDSTAASYKFFWFLVLLRLLRGEERLSVHKIAAEMIIAAWAPAVLYRLSFGAHDRLQNALRDLQAAQRLRPTATEGQVRAALAVWGDAPQRIEALSQLVPTRFLGPWLELDIPPSVRDDRRTRAIVRAALAAADDPSGPPYSIDRGESGLEIRFGPGWSAWLMRHRLILEAQAELHLARFLQARNPHVPGILDKVRMPGARKLAPARRAFERLRAATGALTDPYSQESIRNDYVVDHILPRSFVAHDLVWNLVPTSAANNSDKGECLPAQDLLDPIARFHFALVKAAPSASELDDYVAVFGLSDDELRAMSEADFITRYQAMITPLLLIAAAQGFRRDWRPLPPGLNVRKSQIGKRLP